MKEIYYLILDLATSLAHGYLLYYLLQKGCRRQKGNKQKIGIIPVYVLAEFFRVNIPFLKKIYYGDDMAPTASRQTILPAATVLFVVCVYCILFLKNNRAKCLYLIFTFFSYKNLMRYSFYTFWQYLIEWYSGRIIRRVEQGKLDVRHFKTYMQIGEICWNTLFSITILLAFVFLVRELKKYTNQMDVISRKEMVYLYMPIVMAIFYDVFLRIILFNMNDGQVMFLLTDNPEMRLLVPAMSILGMLLIYFSLYTFVKLKKEQEEKSMLLIYENRLSEMGQHIKEVEQLYEGIRGMKHDLKNYVADIEAMLENKEEDSSYRMEMRKYLQGICQSLEELDITYHTGNPVTDVVISRYLKRAADMEIITKCSFGFPRTLHIDAFDISILLHNGLENALEALQSERKLEKEAYLSIRSIQKDNIFVLEIKNSFWGEIYDYDESKLPLTSKREGLHGYGIKNMKRCAQKYKGDVHFCIQKNEAILTIMLQKKE